MKSNERLVYFFELKVGANKVAAIPPSLSEVVARLQEALSKSAASLQLNKDTATIEIVEIRVDNNRHLATFFFRYADRNGADVYITDPALGSSRIERKRNGEGRGFGAHFSVSLVEESSRPNLYMAVLERVTGVSSAFVVRLFQSILRDMYREDGKLFVCDDVSGARDRNGQPKKVGFRPMLDLHGLPSDQFVADLERGFLQEIQLIQDKEATQFGSRPWLSEKQRVVKLAAGSGVPGVSQLWTDLKTLFASEASNGFTRARINFKREDGQRDTVEVDAETGSLLDYRYVKAKQISAINPPLDECSDQIVDHFAATLEAELVANRT